MSFNDLSDDKDHRQILNKLKRELTLWQKRTNDPLRHPELLGKLKAEIEATVRERRTREESGQDLALSGISFHGSLTDSPTGPKRSTLNSIQTTQ